MGKSCWMARLASFLVLTTCQVLNLRVGRSCDQVCKGPVGMGRHLYLYIFLFLFTFIALLILSNDLPSVTLGLNPLSPKYLDLNSPNLP